MMEKSTLLQIKRDIETCVGRKFNLKQIRGEKRLSLEKE